MGYRSAAVTLWGDAGAYVHDCYDRWRHLYPELPDDVPIVIGITAYGRCVGLTRTTWEHGPRITIQSRLFRDVGIRAVEDMIVHEMLHAWLAVTGQDTKHSSEAWYAAVRRLSPPVLGHELDARRGADRRSVRMRTDDGKSVIRKVINPAAVPHKVVASWPVRPAGYDWGPTMACPSY